MKTLKMVILTGYWWNYISDLCCAYEESKPEVHQSVQIQFWGNHLVGWQENGRRGLSPFDAPPYLFLTMADLKTHWIFWEQIVVHLVHQWHEIERVLLGHGLQSTKHSSELAVVVVHLHAVPNRKPISGGPYSGRVSMHTDFKRGWMLSCVCQPCGPLYLGDDVYEIDRKYKKSIQVPGSLLAPPI